MNSDIRKLCDLDGASGNEAAVREYVTNKLDALGLSYTIDALGNVIAEKKGRKTPIQKIMVAAHMDEVALIVTGIHKDGYLHFGTVGGVDARVLPGKPVRFGEIKGVIGCVPVHLTDADARKKDIPLKNLYIDIGAADEGDARKLVSEGDIAYFDMPYTELGGGRILAKAIDDRAGVAAMLMLAGEEHENDVTLAFTVQEEVGCRGAITAAYAVKPDIALILESTTAADNAGLSGPDEVCHLGKGAVVGYLDSATIYDRELVETARKLAGEKNIPCQIKRGVFGGNDAGKVHISRSGVRTLAISAPCRNLHTGSCVADSADIKAVYDLCLASIDAID